MTSAGSPSPLRDPKLNHYRNVMVVLGALEHAARGETIPLHLALAAAWLLEHHDGTHHDQLSSPEFRLLYSALEAAHGAAFRVLTSRFADMWATRDGLIAMLELLNHWKTSEADRAEAGLTTLEAARTATAIFGLRCLDIVEADGPDFGRLN